MSVRNWRTSRRSDAISDDTELQTIKDCLVLIREEQTNQKAILNNILEAQTLLSEKVDAIRTSLKSLENNGLQNGKNDVVSLGNRTGNPARTVPTEPSGARSTSGKKSQRSKRQRLCAMSAADLPGEPLFKYEPEEKDFVNLLKALRVDVNESTIQAVAGATKAQTPPTSSSNPSADTVLVIDASLSMKGEPFQELTKFVNGFIDELDKTNWDLGLEERVSVILCGSTTSMLQPFTTQYDDIREILDQLQIEGKTPLLTALTLALCYIDGKGESLQVGKKTLLNPRVIVLSDFNPTNDKEPFDDETEETGRENKKIQRQLLQLSKIYRRQMLGIYCVPFGRNKNTQFARALAENSNGGELFTSKDHVVAGNYLRYNVVAARVCDDYDASVAGNEDRDPEEILQEIMPLAKCDRNGKDAIVKVITKTISGSDPGSAPYEEESEPEVGSHRSKKRHHKRERQTNPEVVKKYQDYMDEKKKRPEMLPVVFDDSGMPEWIQSKMDSIGFVEFSELPPLGSRVRRGRDWDHDDDDGRKPGTIVGHMDKEVLIVLFDNDKQVYCKCGKDGKYDVKQVDEPRRVPRDHIEIGCSVKRGPDWRKKDEDGGRGSVGAVIRKASGRMVMVRWRGGSIQPYKFGLHDRYEVEVTDECTNFKNEPIPANVTDSGLPGADQMHGGGIAAGQTPGVTSGQSNASKMPWWKWKDAQGNWRPFSEEAVQAIEQAKTNRNEFACVKYKNKDFMVFFNENKCEFDGGKFDVTRELVSDDDRMSMIELDNYFSAV